MAVAGVDLLETVQVADAEDGVATGGDELGDVLLQVPAVGQAGERVRLRLTAVEVDPPDQVLVVQERGDPLDEQVTQPVRLVVGDPEGVAVGVIRGPVVTRAQVREGAQAVLLGGAEGVVADVGGLQPGDGLDRAALGDRLAHRAEGPQVLGAGGHAGGLQQRPRVDVGDQPLDAEGAQAQHRIPEGAAGDRAQLVEVVVLVLALQVHHDVAQDALAALAVAAVVQLDRVQQADLRGGEVGVGGLDTHLGGDLAGLLHRRVRVLVEARVRIRHRQVVPAPRGGLVGQLHGAERPGAVHQGTHAAVEGAGAQGDDRGESLQLPVLRGILHLTGGGQRRVERGGVVVGPAQVDQRDEPQRQRLDAVVRRLVAREDTVDDRHRLTELVVEDQPPGAGQLRRAVCHRHRALLSRAP